MEGKKYFSAKRLTGIAVLLALVIVLQTVFGSIKIGATSFSLVLIPIVLGGILYGWIAGGLLGFAFGFITLMYGVTGADAFTAILFQDHPFLTILTCIVKATAAGIIPALVYKVFKEKHAYVGVFIASALAPIVNTGLFIIGALLMSDTIAGFAGGNSVSNIMYFLIIGCAGVNFLVEFAVNLIASPSIYRVICLVDGKIKRK